jgi:hypothetical protein
MRQSVRARIEYPGCAIAKVSTAMVTVLTVTAVERFMVMSLAMNREVKTSDLGVTVPGPRSPYGVVSIGKPRSVTHSAYRIRASPF